MKIKNLTHCDLDGIGCSIVLGNVYGKKNVSFTSLGYKNLVSYIGEFIEQEIYENYDKTYITDISLCEEDFNNIFPSGELPESVYLIDHHETTKFCKGKKRCLWDDSRSGTALVYSIMKKSFPEKVSHLERLVEVVEDYDLFIEKIPEAKDLNRLYFWMWGRKFYDRFFTGDIKFLPEEAKYVKNFKKEIRRIQENTDWKLFADEKLCFATVPNHHHDVTSYIYDERPELLGSIVLNEKLNAISIKGRRDHIRENNLCIGDFCEKYGGGGHREVGGIGISNLDWPRQLRSLMEDFEEFMIVKDG